MKWTKDQVAILRTMCEEEMPNAEIAKTLKVSVQDVHAKRSQLGITIPKIKAAKAAAPQVHPEDVAIKAFDALEKALIEAGAADPRNACHFRMGAGAISTIKSLLLAALV